MNEKLQCRGCIALGTACLKCDKCRSEIKRYPGMSKRIEALEAAIRKHKENCDRIIGECETDSSRHVRAWIEHNKLWSILDAPSD